MYVKPIAIMTFFPFVVYNFLAQCFKLYAQDNVFFWPDERLPFSFIVAYMASKFDRE